MTVTRFAIRRGLSAMNFSVSSKKTVATLSQTTTTITSNTVVTPASVTSLPKAPSKITYTHDLVKNLSQELKKKKNTEKRMDSAPGPAPAAPNNKEAFLRTKYYEGFHKGQYGIEYFENAIKN